MTLKFTMREFLEAELAWREIVGPDDPYVRHLRMKIERLTAPVGPNPITLDFPAEDPD